MATSLAETCAELGDAEPAEALLAILDEGPGRVALLETGHLSGGAVDLFRGGLLVLLGRLDEAVDAYERAEALNRRLDARCWLARTHIGLASALVARDRPGDRERAADLAERAGRDARELGMPAVVARAAEFRLPPSSTPPCTSS
jgi:hypothetical protein